MVHSPPRGALQNQMDTGVRLTTSKGWGIRWEHNLKKWEVIGWKSKFLIQNLRVLGENVTSDLSVSTLKALKAGICNSKKSLKMAKIINLSLKLKQKVASYGSRIKKNKGSLGESAIREPTFYQKCGVFGWQQRQSAKIWGHWVTAALKIGGLLSLTSTSSP